MRVGFDYWNTVSRNPELFRILASSILSEGGEVFIVSAIGPTRSQGETVEQIKKTLVPCDDIYILTWVSSPDEVPALKWKICERLGIQVFFDDRKDVCDYLSLMGVQAFNYVKPIPKAGKKITISSD